MKRLKAVLAALVVISFMVSASGGLGYAQPNIPKEKIPSDILSVVREQIERLYSSDPVERGHGAYRLGEMGTKATPAIPFLIGMLGDDAGLIWIPHGVRGDYIRMFGGPGGKQTSPGWEASDALVKIGEPTVKPLIAALKDEDSGIHSWVPWALERITGQDFGKDPIKWQKWWEENKGKFGK